MTKFEVPKKIIAEFIRNLNDWCEGGPKTTGWTRTGSPISYIKAKLVSYRFKKIHIEEVLAKNPSETQKWHLDFLKFNKQYEETDYYNEYLFPRYGHDSLPRAHHYRWLFDDIKNNGITKPVWVAEMPSLGFRYFRFNGCHRTCVAKSLGINQVEAIVFKTVLL